MEIIIKSLFKLEYKKYFIICIYVYRLYQLKFKRLKHEEDLIKKSNYRQNIIYNIK